MTRTIYFINHFSYLHSENPYIIIDTVDIPQQMLTLIFNYFCKGKIKKIFFSESIV